MEIVIFNNYELYWILAYLSDDERRVDTSWLRLLRAPEMSLEIRIQKS